MKIKLTFPYCHFKLKDFENCDEVSFVQTGCLGVPEFLHQLQLQTQVKKEKITNRKNIEILIKEENNNKQTATYAGNSVKAVALMRIKINLGK